MGCARIDPCLYMPKHLSFLWKCPTADAHSAHELYYLTGSFRSPLPSPSSPISDGKIDVLPEHILNVPSPEACEILTS